MNYKPAIDLLFSELSNVAAHAPNERLPKEEQSRCILYAHLRSEWPVVCVERGYRSIDEGGEHRECDLLAIWVGRPDFWLEMKHCRCAREWQNKPSEELKKWEDDLDKLRLVPSDSDRIFLLVCFSDFDTREDDLPRHGAVVRNVRSFHPSRLMYADTAEFRWRIEDGITHVNAWIWHWHPGEAIEQRVQP
jgi:hypothetical protein